MSTSETEEVKRINLKLGKVYKLYCPEESNGLIYVGSTTTALNERLNRHKTRFRAWEKDEGKRFIASIDLFVRYGINNIDIELLEEVEFKHKIELEICEKKWIRILKSFNIAEPGIISDKVKKEIKELNDKELYDRIIEEEELERERNKEYFREEQKQNELYLNERIRLLRAIRRYQKNNETEKIRKKNLELKKLDLIYSNYQRDINAFTY